MAGRLNRGEIWLYEFRSPDKRRPVLVLTRQDAIPYLNSVLVAPVTSTRRGSAGEVPVGIEEGLKHDSAVNLDQVKTVRQDKLRRFIGSLSSEKMKEVCSALAIATGCS